MGIFGASKKENVAGLSKLWKFPQFARTLERSQVAGDFGIPRKLSNPEFSPTWKREIRDKESELLRPGRGKFGNGNPNSPFPRLVYFKNIRRRFQKAGAVSN